MLSKERIRQIQALQLRKATKSPSAVPQEKQKQELEDKSPSDTVGGK